jgi:hypothetical protein
MAKVILSTDSNPDYLFYLPITASIWRHFGFEPVVITVGQTKDGSDREKLASLYAVTHAGTKPLHRFKTAGFDDYKHATLAQFSRLYGSCLVDDDSEYVILGDIDICPLNDFLFRDMDKMNCFGFDLTDRTQQPMCYVGMQAGKWREFMGLTKGNLEEQMKRDLDTIKDKATSQDFYTWWDVDQHFLTQKIDQYGRDRFQWLDRGKQKNGYARARADRGNWVDVIASQDYMDAHMLRPLYEERNWDRTCNLMRVKGVYQPWWDEYRKEFLKLT